MSLTWRFVLQWLVPIYPSCPNLTSYHKYYLGMAKVFPIIDVSGYVHLDNFVTLFRLLATLFATITSLLTKTLLVYMANKFLIQMLCVCFFRSGILGCGALML